jgi:peptide/nickel transport system permease protein
MVAHLPSHAQAITLRLMRAVAVLVLATFGGALLLRLAPGRDYDEQQLDSRISGATVELLRQERAARQNLPSFFVVFFRNLARGDVGMSDSFGRPVADLIRERIGTTTRSVATGLCAGWLAALLVAAAAAPKNRVLAGIGAVAASGTLLSVPASVLAIVCLLLELPPSAAIAAVVFPRVFPHAHAQLRFLLYDQHVVMARARGIRRIRLFWWQILPGALPPLLALAGVSVTIAFGASIPIEVLADSPGVGQLAWRATLSRDMPLLVAMTLIVAAVTVVANLISDLVLNRFRVGTP